MSVTDESEYMEALDSLNRMPVRDAYKEFLACCGSPRFATEMTAARPYKSVAALHEKAHLLWWSLPRDEWLNAFAAHPKIGKKFTKSCENRFDKNVLYR
jgi:hypothetical protein